MYVTEGNSLSLILFVSFRKYNQPQTWTCLKMRSCSRHLICTHSLYQVYIRNRCLLPSKSLRKSKTCWRSTFLTFALELLRSFVMLKAVNWTLNSLLSHGQLWHALLIGQNVFIIMKCSGLWSTCGYVMLHIFLFICTVFTHFSFGS